MFKDLFALIFGAVIVVFYSYRRFNRRTDGNGQQLLRVVNLLSPDKLRSKRVVHHAYFLYATTFLIIYLFLCAYAQLIPAIGGPSVPIGASALPALQTQQAKAGFQALSGGDVGDAELLLSLSASAGTTHSGNDLNFGISAATSLAVALMIVGLAPSFPLLEDFETSIRAAAHRLAGIPTRVIGIRDALRTRTLSIPGIDTDADSDFLLIPRGAGSD
jgi:hypothetical protein